MAQVSKWREDERLMKRSYQSTIKTNSKQSYDDGPKRIGFQSSGIYLKPDNKVKLSDNKINPTNLKANVYQANKAFEQIKRTCLKSNNNNQLNSTASSIQTSASSPNKRQAILSPSSQILSKKAAQLFANLSGSQPQTAIFTNLMTPAAKSSAGNPQSASKTTPSPNSQNISPIQPKNPQQENLPIINHFINVCRTQTGQNDGGGVRPNFETNVPKMGNSSIGPNFASNNSLSNIISPSQNASNLSSILGKNVVTSGPAVPTFTNQSFQNPQQNILASQNSSQNIFLSQNNDANLGNHITARIQQQSMFQSLHQNPPIPQSNSKTNKPSNNSQKPATKYTKIPTIASNSSNNNHISLDGYFPNISGQESRQTYYTSPTTSQNANINQQPNLSSPPKYQISPTVPYLFDPNYHFQYVSDPIFQQQMEIQMDDLTVEEFVAKATAEIIQVCSQLQQICNKCIGRLKERSQVGQINNIFYQLDKYTLSNSRVSRELDLLESQQYEIEKSLINLEKIFPENCLHSLSFEIDDCRELEELIRGLTEQQQNQPHFHSVLLLYQSLNTIEERVKEMDDKLDLLSSQQQQ